MIPTFGILVATLGRPTLGRALASVRDQCGPDDDLLVVGAGPAIAATAAQYGARFLEAGPFGNWGNGERDAGLAAVRGSHLGFLDDDDVFAPGAFAAMRATAAAHPGRPLLFKMIAPWGETLWRAPVLREGNFGGPQFVTPNDPARLGRFGTRYEGDYDFVMSTLQHYPPAALVWADTVTYVTRPGAV